MTTWWRRLLYTEVNEIELDPDERNVNVKNRKRTRNGQLRILIIWYRYTR